jgi:hypothetical protein
MSAKVSNFLQTTKQSKPSQVKTKNNLENSKENSIFAT